MRISLVNNEFSRTSQEVQRHVQTRFFLHTYSWQNEDNHDAQWLQYEIEGLRFWQSHTIFYPFWFHKKPSEVYKLLVKTRLFQDPKEVQRHVQTLQIHTYSCQNEDNHNAQWLQYKIESVENHSTMLSTFWQYTLVVEILATFFEKITQLFILSNLPTISFFFGSNKNKKICFWNLLTLKAVFWIL